MAQSAVNIPDHSGATTVAPTAVGELPPDVLADATFLARYESGEKLGEGGMGFVRACIDRRIGREVAMKIVRPGEGSRGDLKARFLREACVQGQLEHPAIVPVYDLGRDPEGTLYFTMKRVRGATFEQIVDALRGGDAEATSKYTRHKLLSAFASVCHAVAFAHARGVVHRDLKPDNVMLGDYGEVYVLDWGLAKVVGVSDEPLSSSPQAISSGSDPGAKTVVGVTMGTPGYMAPEQVRGEAVDARADVYALGLILFELLALEPLHPQESAKQANASTLHGTDARPSARAPDRDLPPELDEVCARATALDPRGRWPGVREMVEAVDRYLDGDRDLERRRAVAREHVKFGAEHADKALQATGAEAMFARTMALREIGRAIALDSTNEDAVRTLMRLMTEPPREVPADAQRSILLEARRGVRQGARVTLWANLVWFAYTPLMLWMGMRSWALWSLAAAAWLGTAAASYIVSRNHWTDTRRHLWLTVPRIIAVMSATVCFGPYVIVPSMAVLGVMVNQMSPNRAGRARIVVMYCAAIVVPAALEWFGLVPAHYLFQHDSLIIAPSMLSFAPLPTHVFLVASSLGLIITGAVVLARFRDRLSEVEQRLHVQAWQLRQLVPEHARPASSGPEMESLGELPSARPMSE